MAKRGATTDQTDQEPAAPASPADHAELLRQNAENAPHQADGPAATAGLPAVERMRRLSRKRLDDGSRTPGGAFIRGATLDEESGKHYGGQVVDSEGNILAYFDDDDENTGNADDGDVTDLGKKPFDERPKTGR